MKQSQEQKGKRRDSFSKKILERKNNHTKSGEDKVCSGCKKSVDIKEFQKDTRYLHGYRKRCKKCKVKQTIKSYRKKIFGMTPQEYEEFFVKHKNVCDVCGSNKSLGIDHCHKTGGIRGLLCTKCNTALGLVNDDNKILKNLINYLNKKDSVSIFY